MKIRTGSYILFAIFVLILAVFAGGTYFNFLEKEGATESNIVSTKIIQKIFELDILTNDYLSDKQERIIKQWQLQYSALGEAISHSAHAGHRHSEKEVTILEEMRKDYKDLGAAFTRLTQQGIPQESESKLMSQLLVKSQFLVADSFELSNSAAHRIVEVRRRDNYFISIVSVLFSVGVLMTMYIVFSRILTPVRRLSEGVEIVGAGNLDYKIGIKSKDELGQLGRAFDRMSGDLKKKTLELEEKIQKADRDRRATLYLVEDLNETVKDLKATTISRQWFATTLASIGDAVIATDTKGFITFINPVAQTLTGWKQEEANGKLLKEVFKIINEQTREPVEDPVAKAIREGTVVGLANHTVLIAKDGRETPIDDSAAPIKNQRGELTGVVLIFRDVTERRKINQMKDDFLAMASHELRTPLTIIKGGIENVLDEINGKINEAQKQTLSIVKNNTDRLARLINNILDLDKIEAGKIEFKPAAVKLSKIIDEAIKEFDNKAKEKKIVLTADLAGKPLLVFADADRLQEILDNLIGNAIKFTGEGGRISIEGRELENMVEISVMDNGRGIDKEDIPKLFSKFTQFARAVGPGSKGTGLGLAITKGLVELQGGKIWAESEPGKGSKFTFSIPKTKLTP
jgi:PAS domain S-box-containing protein